MITIATKVVRIMTLVTIILSQYFIQHYRRSCCHIERVLDPVGGDLYDQIRQLEKPVYSIYVASYVYDVLEYIYMSIIILTCVSNHIYSIYLHAIHHYTHSVIHIHIYRTHLVSTPVSSLPITNATFLGYTISVYILLLLVVSNATIV